MWMLPHMISISSFRFRSHSSSFEQRINNLSAHRNVLPAFFVEPNCFGVCREFSRWFEHWTWAQNSLNAMHAFESNLIFWTGRIRRIHRHRLAVDSSCTSDTSFCIEQFFSEKPRINKSDVRSKIRSQNNCVDFIDFEVLSTELPR